MKLPFKSVVWLFIAAIAAPAISLGQGYPMPGSSSQPPVICVLCGNLPTYPYAAPIVTHRGRYLDSTRVRELQAPVRTFRAERVAIVPERDRIYMKLGSALVSYRLSTFFASDLNGPMQTMTGRGEGEQYLQYLGWVYPEKQGEWVTVFQDGQERMGPGFDWDDRGYVYFPARIFGWGILRDVNGEFQFVKQLGGPLGGPGSDVGPTGIISFKHEAKYYAYVYDVAALRGALFDVTNPADPAYIKPLTHGIRNFAKTQVGGAAVIAYTDSNDGDIKIFSAAGFIAGAGPDKVISPPSGSRFTSVASDGLRIFGAAGSPTAPGKFAVIAASGSSAQSYSADFHSIPGDVFFPTSISYSMDAITMTGFGGAGNTMHMFRLTGNGPQYVDFNNFFMKYYSGTYEDSKQYAAPGFCNQVLDAVFYREGNKEYVVYASNGLGDVYQIQASDGVSIERDATAGNGTANPYSEGGVGPYYGDVFRFKTAATGSAVAIDVDYGNPETSSGNVASSITGQNLTYRYSGLNNSSKIQQTRAVRITAAGDTTKTAAVNVTMAVPTARVRGWRSTGIKDPSLLFIQPNASATAPLVVGDSFVDASDGSVESHYSSWTLDGAAAVTQFPNVPFSVGQCGSHTLSFNATYGAYDVFVSRTPSDYSVGVSNINYAVLPFASRIAVVASDSSGIRFRPDVRVGTGAVVAGADVTVTWELLDASGQRLRTPQVTSVPLSNNVSAEFSVSSQELTSAKSVRLTVALVNPAAIVGVGCAGMASTSDSVQLLVPDPVLAVTPGTCLNAGGPCSITVNSSAGQNEAAWTYAWSLASGTAGLFVEQNATGKTYVPGLTQVGTYRVRARVQNEAGISATSAEATFTLEKPLCTTKPEGLSFTWSGVDGSCTSGTCTSANTIRFNPKAWGYSFQDCDSFTWTFGDGQTSAEKYPEHKYAADGTYSVRLTVSNSEGSDFADQSIQLGAGPPPPPPPPPPTGCEAPSQRVDFSLRGNTSGCNGLVSAGDCATGESISFTAVNYPPGKAFQSCDVFSWEFGDGSTSSSQNPTKVYSQAGTYIVKFRVSNPAGAIEAGLSIKVAGGYTPPPDSSCKAPNDRAYLEFSAPSGCSSVPGSNPCNPGEVVTLSLKTLGAFQACDTFDWNFGDGTTTLDSKSTTVQHQFPAIQPDYTVTVTIKNTSGSAVVTEKVRFGLLGVDKPTSIDFSASGATPIIGVPVTFTATADAPASYPVTNWSWDFGDGITATGNPVQHTFSTEGTWPVTLTASNAGGSAAPVTKQIKVLKANAFTYLLPVVSHLNGANGSKWRTDVQIYNANMGEGAVELEFELTTTGQKKTFSLNTSTLIYEDFMSFFTDADTAGPVIVRGAATHDLQIWTRTYSLGASGVGTFGHLIPAVRIDGDQNFTAGDSTFYMTGVNLTQKYRTNVYLLNITPQTMPVTITAYESHFGAALGQFTTDAQPFQLTQITDLANRISGLPNDKPFSVAIKGTSSGLVAYESVVDNGSNDPIYIPAISTTDLADLAMRNQILPSVGHAGTWRSDVTVFNPDDSAIQFDLSFYMGETGELLAEAKDQILPAKGLLQLDDIMWSSSMIPQVTTDVIGTLRVTVDSPLADQFVVVAQRNYSDSGDQKRFGQGILAFAAAKPNVATGKPAILPAVRSDLLYRSNVGLVNVGASDANVTLSLLDHQSGQNIGMYSLTLKPNESKILPDMIRFLHQTADRGSIKVEVTNDASVWAFASIIDRATNDPEYVPAIPLD